MHGRVKVRTSEEQAEAKRREQEEKLKVYQGATSKIFAKRKNKEYGEESLELTGRLLEKNPDFYTLWNFRREILLSLKAEKSKEEIKRLSSVELDLTQNCLRVNPKSYGAWHHRFWALEFDPNADWKKELKLCGYFLSKDERNFHCWDYRRLICKKCNVVPEDELTYSMELIETNFSNYSAWHYRSTLLPVVHPGPTKGSLKEEILLKELDLVQNAAFTDPDDQSVWFYHRWLLGRSKIPLQILNVSIFKPQKMVSVLFSEPIKVNSKSINLKVNESYVDDVSWISIGPVKSASTVWVCNLPLHLDLEIGKCEVTVELIKGEEKNSLSCSINGCKSAVWKNTSRADLFRSNLSATAKDVLESELESCQQLNNLEPNCKWTLFTCVLLMRALNDTKFDATVSDYMEQLTKVDDLRKNYYKDLGSRFIIENTIETLSMAAIELDLSQRRLTSLHHFDQFILIEEIDLSSNCLTSVIPLSYLISVESIILDDNLLSDLAGLEDLQNLEFLSVKENSIEKISKLEALKSCTNLQELFLEDNPVLYDPEYFTFIAKLSTLKVLDAAALR